jgi:hypothetical protein
VANTFRLIVLSDPEAGNGESFKSNSTRNSSRLRLIPFGAASMLASGVTNGLPMKGFATLLLALAIASAARADNLMAGAWYTEGVENGVHLQSIVENNPDGTFTKHIRNGTDCQAISSWDEAGTWTFDGREYVEVTATVNGQKVETPAGAIKDAFDVTRIDDAHMTLLDAKTQIAWTLAKVAPNYAMSPPKDCTV